MALGDIVLLKDRTPFGPFTRRQIQDGLSRGEFSAQDLAHTPGLKDWLPLLEVLHHLDREVVHLPRTREGVGFPPVPNDAARYAPPEVAPVDPPVREPSSLPPTPDPAPEEVREFARAATPPDLPPIQIFSSRPPSLPVPADAEPARMAPRIGAWLIDWLVLFLPILITFGIAYGIWYARGSLEHRDAETARQERELLYRNLRDLVLLVANGFAWLYAAGLESSRWQATIGKQLMGLVVTDTTGHRISFIRATGRHAARYLSALPVFAGFMAALFNPQRLTWHDRLSATRVVKVARPSPRKIHE